MDFMPLHTDACQDGARSFQAQQSVLWSRGWRNQTPQWVLMRACWTAELSVCQSGKWNVKNDLYQAQFWVKALLFKAYLGSRIFLKVFFFGFLFSFVLICLILLVCGEVFSLKAAVGMQTFVKLITIIKT